MAITLQKAGTDDWQEILNFEKLASSRFFHAMTTQEEAEKYLQNSEVFFIISDDQKVGTLSYEIKEGANHIDGLTIKPELRKRGIAQEAIRFLVEKENKPFELYVHPENTSAILVYLKNGFKIVAWKENIFGDNEPRILMRRK